MHITLFLCLFALVLVLSIECSVLLIHSSSYLLCLITTNRYYARIVGVCVCVCAFAGLCLLHTYLFTILHKLAVLLYSACVCVYVCVLLLHRMSKIQCKNNITKQINRKNYDKYK